jgi:hypothetical protein
MLVTKNAGCLAHEDLHPGCRVSSQQKSSVKDNLDIGQSRLNLYPFLDLDFVLDRLLQEITGSRFKSFFRAFEHNNFNRLHR